MILYIPNFPVRAGFPPGSTTLPRDGLDTALHFNPALTRRRTEIVF
jgi:hypothetical protein